MEASQTCTTGGNRMITTKKKQDAKNDNYPCCPYAGPDGMYLPERWYNCHHITVKDKAEAPEQKEEDLE
jgi:hypothetical protein